MLDLVMYCLIVFAMTFMNSQTIPTQHFEEATLNCKEHGGLKALSASSYFGKDAFTAICVDGTSVQEKTK